MTRGARCASRVALVLLLLVAAPSAVLLAAPEGEGLIEAVKRRDATAVQSLLRGRADVNATEGDGTTALHWAVDADDLQMVTTLLKAGARATVANRLGVTPIVLAATNGSAAVIEALLKAGANANDASAEGETVLMAAARSGNPAAVAALVKAGAQVNATEGWRGETALMWAAAENHGAVVTLLIEHGAQKDARSRLLTFPTVRYNLATHGTIANPQGGFTALMFAARQGAVDAVRALADAGADLNTQEPDGTTALTIAIGNGHTDAARVLIERGANPNLADNAGTTPLFAAVELHTTEMYPERKPRRTPGGAAGTLDLIRLMLAKGADPDPRLKRGSLRWGRGHSAGDGALTEGSTPLMRAARFGDVAAMRVLLDAKADPAVMQKDRTTVLMLAAGAGWRTGETILGGTDYGEESDAIEAVKLCLERGADVNAADEDGLTALHHAVVRGSGVVRLLVDHGARLDTKDKHGRTPLDVAQGVMAPREQQRMRTSPLREASAALLRQLTAGTSVQSPPR
jgi:ankyrin repeat protein